MKIHLCGLAIFSLLFVTGVQARHVDIAPYYEVDANGNRTLSVGSFDLAGEQDGSQSIERNALLFYGEAVPVFDNDHNLIIGNRINGDPGWHRPMDFNNPHEGDGAFGANYPAGTMPPGYGKLGFNVVVDPRLGRNLSYWDGTGTPSFGPVPGGEILDLYKTNPLGPPANVVTLAGEATGAAGFTITPSPGGLFPNYHEHTAASLWGSASRDPNDAPAPGFYLYSRNLTVTDDVLNFGDHFDFIPGTVTSPTFHTILAYHLESDFVYEYGDPLYEPRGHFLTDENGEYVENEFGDWIWVPDLDEFGNPLLDPILDEFGNPVRELLSVHSPKLEAAVNWVNTNLQPVPEPGSICLAGLGAVGIAALFAKKRRAHARH